MPDLTAPLRRAIAIGAVIALLALVVLVLAFCQARKDAATSGFDRNVAKGQASQGEQAATITADQVKAEADNAATTARNREDILNAPNSQDTAGAAGDAGLRALCQRVRYRDSLRCVELQRADRYDASR